MKIWQELRKMLDKAFKTNITIHFEKEDLMPLFATLLLSVMIITVGYRLLDIAGNHFINTDSNIEVYSSYENNSYIFYAQSDSDIALFPWDYYDSSNPNYYDYLSNYSQLYRDELDLRDYMNVEKLYKKIEYSFYKSMPEAKELIDTSLYDIMKFNNIAYDLSVSNEASGLYFFYTKTISFEVEIEDNTNSETTDNNEYEDTDTENFETEYLNDTENDSEKEPETRTYSYDLSFAFNSKLELLYFKCCPTHNNSEYTSTTFSIAKNQLTNLINFNPGSLSMLICDMLYQNNILQNYNLVRISDNNYTFTVSDSYGEPADDDSTIGNNEYDSYDDIPNDNKASGVSDEELSEIAKKLSQNQIIETNNEILIIIMNCNIVLHFDPLEKAFTGYNLISN